MKIFIVVMIRFIIFAILISGLFLTVFLNMQYRKSVGYLEEKRVYLQGIVRENEELQIKIAKAYPFAKIEKLAQERLGMFSPKKVEFVIVND